MSSAKRDYYEILGIAKNATDDEIKKAYRQAALKHHPDKNPGDKAAEDKFKEAAEAYDVLRDSEKRKRYDQFGHAGMGSGFGGGGGFSGGGFSMDDIFSSFGDIFGDFGFGGGGGSRGGRTKKVNRGTNLRVRVKLTLEEVVKGVEKKIKVNKYVECKTCHGTGAKHGSAYNTCTTCKGSGYVTRIANTMLGQMQTTSTCPHCGGEGKIISEKCTTCFGNGIVKEEEVISINIPAGVTEGMQLSLNGKGNAAARGGIPGDLIVVIEEEEHADLQRDGINLVYEHFISFPDAVMGSTIEVPTIDGRAKIKIEPGTLPGKVLRLKGKGIPEVNGYNTGDLLININVWVPKSVSKEEKIVLEKLKNSDNFKPNPTTKDKNIFSRMKDFFH
ncbi:MAG: molecular chaperone DnaJ [Bacteroidetes bacterium GWF2_29_10]|nr:MAG: molecular chaperone DnaJ [Bacteroidetes bacterium GWF2_29_10]